MGSATIARLRAVFNVTNTSSSFLCAALAALPIQLSEASTSVARQLCSGNAPTTQDRNVGTTVALRLLALEMLP